MRREVFGFDRPVESLGEYHDLLLSNVFDQTRDIAPDLAPGDATSNARDSSTDILIRRYRAANGRP